MIDISLEDLCLESRTGGEDFSGPKNEEKFDPDARVLELVGNVISNWSSTLRWTFSSECWYPRGCSCSCCCWCTEASPKFSALSFTISPSSESPSLCSD